MSDTPDSIRDEERDELEPEGETAERPAGEEPIDVDALKERAAQADVLQDRLRRAEAEFKNETKRIQRLAQNDSKYAIERVVVDLIPVVDALHSAGSGLGAGEAAERIRAGLDLVGKQLMDVLARYGVELIEAEGKGFDPNRHEAIYAVARDDVEPQMVVEVLRPGFTLHGRVVRPAEVGVSRSAEAATAPPTQTENEDA